MNPTYIKQTAAARLTAPGQTPRRLSALYAGITFGLTLVVAVVNYILSLQLDNAGGLAGIGTRSVLGTAQSALSLALLVALPFVDLGYQSVCLQQARGKRPWPDNLWDGLRRFGPVIRLSLLQILLYGALSFLCTQAAGMLYMFSPFSLPAMELLTELDINDAAALEAAMETVMPLMTPMYIICAVVLLVVLIPVTYRLRLTHLLVLDGTDRALEAIRISNRTMRGHMWQYFLLDLKFWWYYLAAAAVTALGYGDVLLTSLGVTVDSEVLYLVFTAVSGVARFLLMWQAAPLFCTAHALAYDTLTKPQPEVVDP